MSGRAIRVRGTVQGVGFRPFAWRIAREEGLAGTVRNDGAGVLIEVFGAEPAIARFLDRLTTSPPPLAAIRSVDVEPLAGAAPADFVIDESGGGDALTGVPPDAATCPECLAEVRDRRDRRHGFAFGNCTHCGPRLSILRAIPYDRANTSMADFAMCPDCAREYADPADRRFHAQPIACPRCGPKLWLVDGAGAEIPSADPIADAAALLRAGRIVAIKGIGGFQLACDAGDEDAVAGLRRRKQRQRKPFALMARDGAMIAAYALVDGDESAALHGSAAPIVLLDTRPGGERLAPSVAPGQSSLGFMLPATPLHHLLMAQLDRPIVLTSGNLTDEPQCAANDEAVDRLGRIADVLLMNDRAIVNRLDDSVVRKAAGAIRTLRRGRGLAPAPLPAPPADGRLPRVLAMGADLKNAFCLLREDEAVLSQHIGDLGHALAVDDLDRAIGLYLDLYRFRPDRIAVDLHPDYRSRRLGETLAAAHGAALVTVQHHHAHVASCLAEALRPFDAPPVVGVVLDGAGFGPDGSVWGGEVMVADYRRFERRAYIAAVPLPGGDAAAREPWRNAFAHIEAAIGLAAAEQRFGRLAIIERLRAVGNLAPLVARSPRASSAGRLFDAVAAALGLVVERQDFEGEAAMLVEAAAAPAFAEATAYPTTETGRVIGWRGLWAGILGDLADAVPTATIAARFHRTVIDALAAAAIGIARDDGIAAVALSGGSFHNRLLLEGLGDAIGDAGLEVLTQRAAPAGDGGIALGQAMVAAIA